MHYLYAANIPAWINAVTVVVLAGITWWYARSAKRQADAAMAQAKAAESQARAATKQADVAERTLTMLQSQIEEQAGASLARLKENVGELRQAAEHWSAQFARWGAIRSVDEVVLLPESWPLSLEYAHRNSPDLYRELLQLQEMSKACSLQIIAFMGTNATYRRDREAAEIKALLLNIRQRCDEMAV